MVQYIKRISKLIGVCFGSIPRPLAIGWNITARCNFNCTYCMGNRSGVSELSCKEIIVLIKVLARMGMVRLHLLGGEPLCREDLGLVIAEADTLKIRTSLFTNGFILKERFEEIKKVNQISISLDGNSNVQNCYRHPASFERIVEAVDFLKKRNKDVRIITTLYKYNLKEIPFLLDFSKQYQVPVKFHVVVEELTGGKNISDLIPDRETFLYWIDYLIAEKKKNTLLINSLAGLTYLRGWPDQGRFLKCKGAGKLLFQIDPQGRLYSCDMARNNNIKIFPEIQQIREAMKTVRVDGCRRCWCTGTLDFNLACAFNGEVIRSVLRNYGL